MHRLFLATVSLIAAAAFATNSSAQTAVIYDGLNAGTVPTFTTSVPHTYMGQGFNVANPGTGATIQITSMRITMVAAAAVNYAASRLRIQFWDTYNPAAVGTELVFSNPALLQTFNTGAINVAAATAFTFTLNFAVPITLTGLTNHGITVNWQSDAAGTGNFIDDTNLAAALRTGTGGTIPPPPLMPGAADVNPGGGYFRNASGLTTFNFQAGDARTIANVGGLMMEFTAIAVPEPSSVALLITAAAGAFVAYRRRHVS
jgi:hypothetical protein